MMIRRHFLLLAVSALALVPNALPPVFAQDVKLEDVLVTARRREENLMTVPLPISAFSNADIQARGVQDLKDLARFTPGFFRQYAGATTGGRADRSAPSLHFRGLGNIAGGGSLFIDGAPVANTATSAPGDFERVEVLMGPQSVYFGRSTYVGAINYVTRKPSDVFSAKIATENSSYGSTDNTISLEGPIVDGKLSARLSGRHFHKGGQYKNAADPNVELGQQETNGVSLSAYYTPTEALTIKAFVNHFVDDDGVPAQAALLSTQTNCNAGAGVAGRNNYWCGVVPQIARADISVNDRMTPFAYSLLIDNITNVPTVVDPRFLQHGGLRRDAWQSNVIGQYTFESGHVLSTISSYNTERTVLFTDVNFRNAENVPNPRFGVVPNVPPYIWNYLGVQAKNYDWSQEVRLTSPQTDRFRWVAGGTFFKTRVVSQLYGISPAGFVRPGLPSPTGSETSAVFGGAYFDILPQLTISGEMRYEQDEVWSDVPANNRYFEQTNRAASPRVTLDYKPRTDLLFYALYSRGNRPGTFNTPFASLTPAQQAEVVAQVGVADVAVKPEKMDNYEGGVKVKFLDGRASLRAAVYKATLTDQQISRTATLSSGVISAVRVNIGQTDLTGTEINADLQVTDHLLITGSFGIADSNIRTFDCTECRNFITGTADVTGKSTRGVPRTTGSASATYTDKLAGEFDWFGRVDYAYRGTIYADEANVAETGAANIVNVRLGTRTQALSIELFARNLFDDETYNGLFRAGDGILGGNQMRVVLADRRTLGIYASYEF